jgi:hypothetical protein
MVEVAKLKTNGEWPLWVCSDLGSFRQFESILHVNSEVAHSAVDFRVAEQDLDGAKIAYRLIMIAAFVRRSEWVP